MAVEFKKIEHIITKQYHEEQEFLKEYQYDEYTFQNPYVKCNPYLIAPLTALVMFKTEKKTGVSIRVKGKEESGDIYFEFPAATEHKIPVYGLYADYDNQVILTLDNGEEKILSIKTEKAPDDLKTPTKIETSPEYFQDNLMFLTPNNTFYTTAYDYKGDIRWYTNLNIYYDIKRVENGRLLIGSHRLFMPPYHTIGIFEMGMIGKIYKEFRVPGGYHHDHFEKDDGNLLILTQDPSRGTVEDLCVLVDRNTGEILKEFDPQKVLPQDVAGSGSQTSKDWFHNNAVWYDKKTNSVTLSGRHQDAIINMDFDTGELNWILGDPEGWPQDLIDKYFFTPIGDGEFEWQYEQHACLVLPDGDIMTFDNGHWRSKVKEKYIAAKDNYSRGVRYKIDTDKMEIEQVWQYGKERGSDFFSLFISNVEYYGEGHYMVHSGGIVKYKGEASDKLPTQYVGEEKKDVEQVSTTVELRDDKIMYELNMPANYFRAEKLKLYCDKDILTFGKGEILGSLGIAEEITNIPSAKEGGMVPEKYGAQVGLEEDRLNIKAEFDKGQNVILQLEGERNHNYLVPTNNPPFSGRCLGVFPESNRKAVEFPISREGLNGNFNISLIIDEVKYETGINIEL